MLDKQYSHTKTEPAIRAYWEKGGFFTPKRTPGQKPFVILLPPPNANDPLHMGHALFTIEDIMCRYHRMKGEPTLFLPGTDHAGIETQYVFEKKLAKKGKSRFDYDRSTLYHLIEQYVEKNRGVAKEQRKRLGFSLDWSRERFTLEPNILQTVMDTFRRLHADGLIYRDEKIVNYCPHCGTAFSELEVDHLEQEDFLYYLDYGSIQIATTRPETIFADVAVAIHPHDSRHAKNPPQTATVPLLNKTVPVVTDTAVDQEFGTGALKITPAHDSLDFQIGARHQLKPVKIISLEGRMINVPEKYLGLSVAKARQTVEQDLEKAGKVIKKQPLTHAVGICYRCKRTIEPLLFPQWYVKIKPLALPVVKAVKESKTRFFPPRFKKTFLEWMKNIYDWNISRQVVWGPRIPVWYCLDCEPDISLTILDTGGKKVAGTYRELSKTYSFAEIQKGLQNLTAPINVRYQLQAGACEHCQGKHLLQETDTFDTWFSSGQWPLTTLGYPDGKDFQYFYPTSVLDTLWDILFFWVARMMMLGLYRTGKPPFELVHLHCRVVDQKGQKMSKSKGNVINPLKAVETYGADALRLALVFGSSPGSDISISEDKIRAMRNFTNKLWNINRFLHLNWPEKSPPASRPTQIQPEDKALLAQTNQLIKNVTGWIDRYRFDLAIEALYHFVWHQLADKYLETIKTRLIQKDPAALNVFWEVNTICLQLLHPFAPFITEKLWQSLPKKTDRTLTISVWPTEIS